MSESSVDPAVRSAMNLLDGAADNTVMAIPSEGFRRDKNLPYEKHDSTAWRPQLVPSKPLQPLPAAVQAKYKTCEMHTFMGLFPEIRRAFVTFDNVLYLWNYEREADFLWFDKLDQVIVSVGLVVPRPDAFEDFIKYLVVVCTATQVVLLGVAFDGDTIMSDLRLIPTSLVYPTDGVGMLQVAGTANGRIFLAGSDGCVYEVEYDLEQSLISDLLGMSRKCRKINRTGTWLRPLMSLVPEWIAGGNPPIVDLVVDHHHNRLYALTDTGSITCYMLGTDGNEFVQLAQYSPPSDEMPTSIVVVSPTEGRASGFVLAALTNKGGSLFFRLENQESSVWSLSHHGMEASEGGNIGGKFFYSRGIMIGAVTKPSVSPDAVTGDMLHTYALHPVRQPGMISAPMSFLSIELQGKVHAIAEAPPASNTSIIDVFSQEGVFEFFTPSGAPFTRDFYSSTASGIAEEESKTPERGVKRSLDSVSGPARVHKPPKTQQLLNELATQHLLALQREILVLTSVGLYRFTKLRPVDQLAQILLADNAADLQLFTANFPKPEVSATMWILACSASNVAIDNAAAITSPAAGRYVSRDGFTRSLQRVQTAAINALDRHGGNASLSNAEDVKHSARVFGLVLYLKRLLRPVWDRPLFTQVADRPLSGIDARATLPRVFDSSDLRRVSANLVALKNAMPRVFPFLAGDLAAFDELLRYEGSGRTTEERVLLTDQGAVVSAFRLLDRAIQALSLMAILFEPAYHLGRLLAALSPAQRTVVSALTLKLLTTDATSATHARRVVQALLKELAHRPQEVQRLTDQLRRDCPFFFSEGDLHLAQAQQLLVQADASSSVPDIRAKLEESCRLVQLASEHWDAKRGVAVLVDLCRGYCRHHYYLGVIQAALTAAFHISDGNGGTGGNVDERLRLRKQCYTLVTCMLEWVRTGRDTFGCVLSAGGAFDVEEKGTDQLDSDVAAQPPSQQQQQYIEQLREVLHWDDELFHRTLYQWMLDTDQQSLLVSLTTAFIRRFLADGPRKNLLDFHVQHREYGEAARLCYSMATASADDGAEYVLADRVEWLKKAIEHAGQRVARAASAIPEEELAVWQDYLQMACIQLEVLAAFDARFSDPSTAAEHREERRVLESSLLSLQDLYDKYAKKYDLFACCLYILNHRRLPEHSVLVSRYWKKLIGRIAEEEHDVHACVSRLQREVIHVAEMLRDSGSDFAVPFLDVCRELESIATRRQFSHNAQHSPVWVADFILDRLHVPYMDRLHIYMRLLEERNRDTAQDIFKAIEALMRLWLNLPAHDAQFHELCASRLQISQHIKEFMGHAALTDASTGTGHKLRRAFETISKQLDQLRVQW